MSPDGKANAALAASLLFLLISSCSAYLAFSRLNTSRDWVWHTRDVQSSLAQFAMASTRAGRLRAEFADSGDLSRLSQYADGIAKLRDAVTTIAHLTSDNQGQQKNCDRLRRLTEQRILLMNSSIALKRTGGSSLEGQRLITRQIVATAEEIDTLLQQMNGTEEQLLTERQARVMTSSEMTSTVLIASLTLTLVLFLVHHRLLTNQVRARAQAEATLRALSTRVLTLQDQERRKFARDLHDSLGQNLSAIKMAVSLLQFKLPNDPALAECLELLDDTIAETRTISHLLHPPMLDEAGLTSAARWFVEGFGKRSGIQVNLDIREGSERLPESIELALFRVLQESLTNVHRHAGATRAEVSLNTSGNEVILRVKDSGRGIPEELLQNLRETGTGGGVGLASMTERVREIGGRMEVNSSPAGTEVVVHVPIRHRSRPGAVTQLAAEGATGEGVMRI